MPNVSDVLALVAEHKWLAIAALVIGFVVRQLKSDAKLPIDLPSRWRPVAALALGLAAGAIDRMANGTPWKDALTAGAVAGLLAILGHIFGVEVLAGGKELPPLGYSAAAKKERESKRPPPSAPPPGVATAFVLGFYLCVGAAVVSSSACKPTQSQVQTGVDAVEKIGCEVIKAVTSDGSVNTICATVDEKNILVGIVSELLRSAADAGRAYAGDCEVIRSGHQVVCAPPSLLSAAIDRVVQRRQALFLRPDAGAR